MASFLAGAPPKNINTLLRASAKAHANMPTLPRRPKSTLDYAALRSTIKNLMTAHGYVIRTEEGMTLL
jgi:hypothetical protein